jgi:hypothetical protein
VNKPTNSNVVFFSPFGLWTVHNAFDSLLSYALKIRGFEPKVIVCDGLFEGCLLHNNTDSKNICSACYGSNINLFGDVVKHIYKLSNYFDQSDYIEVMEYVNNLDISKLQNREVFKGYELGLLAKIGIHHKFSTGYIDFNDDRILHQLKLNIIQLAILIKTLTKFLNNNSVDYYVMFSGGPIIYRMAERIFKAHGLNGISHERGSTTGTYQFFENENCFSTVNHINNFNLFFKNRRTEITEFKWIIKHLSDRQNGENTNFIKFTDKVNHKYNIHNFLKLDKNKQVISLMLSTDHDTLQGLGERQHLFTDQIECIKYIDSIFKRKDAYLIIKPHPAIHIDKRFFTYLANLQLNANSNLRIILPRDNISSYKLIQISDGILTCGSTVGIESIIYKKPVLSFINNAYAMLDCGIKYVEKFDHISKEVDKLLNGKYIIDTDKITIALKYLLYKFKYCNFRFKSISIENNYNSVIKISDTNDLKPGNCTALDAILNAITNENSIFSNIESNSIKTIDTETTDLEKIIRDFQNKEAINDICLVKTAASTLNSNKSILKNDIGLKIINLIRPNGKIDITHLREAIQDNNYKYYHIINDKIKIRESYPALIDNISEDISAKGYFMPGIWVMDKDNKIKYELFTTFYKAEKQSELTKYINREKQYTEDHGLNNCDDLLNLIIWTKHKLLELLDETIIKGDNCFTLEKLKNFIGDNSVTRKEDILCYMNESQVNESPIS